MNKTDLTEQLKKFPHNNFIKTREPSNGSLTQRVNISIGISQFDSVDIFSYKKNGKLRVSRFLSILEEPQCHSVVDTFSINKNGKQGKQTIIKEDPLDKDCVIIEGE